MILRRLIKIYTPLIAALLSVVHGVLLLSGADPNTFGYLGTLCGHSFLIDIYMLAYNHRSNKWYKTVIVLLILQDLANFLFRRELTGPMPYIYFMIASGILALICFLIYRLTRGLINVLRR